MVKERKKAMADYNIGDVVVMKKKHPCGCDRWEVMRIGADFKIKCKKCAHVVMLSRTKFEKAVKKKLLEDEDDKA